jgi:hypothetical protein
LEQASWSVNTSIIHDIGQFQPRHLTVTVPTGGVSQQLTRNDWLSPDFQDAIESPASPTSAMYSPSEQNHTYQLPTYPFDDAPMDWKPAVMEEDTKPQAMYNPFAIDTKQALATIPITVDPQAISGEGASPPTYSSHTPKARSAHRKAIEEKSSIKRKNAEHRLSQAITNRLGGTFIPGLANQLNQAAELLEQDGERLRKLEEENRILRSRISGTPIDIKHPISH